MVLSLGTAMAATELSSKAAIVVDMTDGKTVYEYNADLRCIPASMTKVMNLYVLFSEMSRLGLTFNSPVYVSNHASTLSKDKGLSNVPLEAGNAYTVDQLVKAVCVHSACGAAVVLAEAVSGSEWAFAQLMNTYASSMGLDAHFSDCYGISDENYITPRSMAVLADRIIREYPVILDYTSLNSFTLGGTTYKATNKLRPGMDFAYPGTDGLKTGTTDEAGCCITATAKQGDRRILAVLFGAPSDKARYADAKALLDLGFASVVTPETGEIEYTAGQLGDVRAVVSAPDSVYFNEDFTVMVQLGNMTSTATVNGQWTVNGVPIEGCGYENILIENGSKFYFDYNPNFYGDGPLNIALRLSSGNDSVVFEQKVDIEPQYKPADAPSKVIFHQIDSTAGGLILPQRDSLPTGNILQRVA